MGLIGAITKGLTTRLAPSNVATQNSTLGLHTSATAMQVLQKSGRRDLQTVTRLTAAIGEPAKLDQATTNNFGSKAGLITDNYRRLVAIEKPFMAGMDDALNAAKLRSKLMTKAAKVGQEISTLDARTQAEIGWSHQKAHAETNYYQSAYGGL